MSEIRPLHRLFGLSWIDFFQGTSIDVETELDLSQKQQFLDLVLIRRNAGSHSRDTSTVLYELFQAYNEEFTMSDKLKEFVRQSIDKLLASLPAEELRNRLPVEERLKGLSAEEVICGLPPETLEALARQHKANGRTVAGDAG